MAKNWDSDSGNGKDRLRDINKVGKIGLSDYLDSRMGERETLRMALRFLSDLGRMRT